MSTVAYDFTKRHRKLKARPKCPMWWTNYGQDHTCKCRKVPGHPAVHLCHCGAQRVKK